MSWRDQCHRLKALWGKVDRNPRAWSDHVPGRGAAGQCACVLGEACRGEPLLTVDALEKRLSSPFGGDPPSADQISLLSRAFWAAIEAPEVAHIPAAARKAGALLSGAARRAS